MKKYLKYWCSPGYSGYPFNALPEFEVVSDRSQVFMFNKKHLEVSLLNHIHVKRLLISFKKNFRNTRIYSKKYQVEVIADLKEDQRERVKYWRKEGGMMRKSLCN